MSQQINSLAALRMYMGLAPGRYMPRVTKADLEKEIKDLKKQRSTLLKEVDKLRDDLSLMESDRDELAKKHNRLRPLEGLVKDLRRQLSDYEYWANRFRNTLNIYSNIKEDGYLHRLKSAILNKDIGTLARQEVKDYKKFVLESSIGVGNLNQGE